MSPKKRLPPRGRSHGHGRAPRRDADDDLAPLKERWVGQLERRGKLLSAVPYFERGRRVTLDRVRDARPGDLVLVRSGTMQRGAPQVERVIGAPDVARVVLEALMLDRGLARRFPPGVERAADEALEATPIEATGGRRDLRSLPTFTIDPVTAKDFDDAISAEQLADDAWRIWVHIADVSAYVRAGSPVDREAYLRSTSIYVPGAVEPMLPQALSNEACSLKPFADRLAVTVEMELTGAEVKRTSFYRSLICSDKRLDYDTVDRIFAGSEPTKPHWGVPLAAARAAAAALGAKRATQGALVVDSVEPDFLFDAAGQVTGIEQSVATESHRLIEHLMILANEQVATLLAERRIPTLYRIHEHPDPELVVRLLDQLASLDVPTPPAASAISPQQAAELVSAASQLIDEHVRRVGYGRAALTSLVLRSLKQARYQPQNVGHAGLGSDCYCHFTSPIRRYPDLICHRALLSAIGAEEPEPRAGALDEAGEWTSARERAAMVIERTADDIARAFLLQRELRRRGPEFVYDGEVVGLIGAGAFVAFGDGYEGMLPVRRMRGDWWELNELGTVLFAAESRRTIRLGDPIRVVVHRVDTARGRVDLDVGA